MWIGRGVRTSLKCEDKLFLALHPDRRIGVSYRLHCEVNAFLDYISPSPVEDEVRGLVIDLVSKAITKAFPDAAVSPFGSYATKLYLPSGYLPIYLLR